MKKTPTESELKDPQWWNDHAPNNADGAWVSRQMIDKQIRSVTWVESDKEGCLVAEDCRATFYRRPTKQSQEWDGEGEIKPGQRVYHVLRGEEVVIVGHDYTKPEPHPVFFADNRYWSAEPGWLKPIRTKEQRERDELVNAMKESACKMQGLGQMADAILAKYELKERTS